MTIYIVELREGHVAEDIDLQKLDPGSLAALLVQSDFNSERFFKALFYQRTSRSGLRVNSPSDITLSELSPGDHILTFWMDEQSGEKNLPISAEWVAGYQYQGYPKGLTRLENQ